MASPSQPPSGGKPVYTIERQQIALVTHLRIRGTIDETFSARQLADSLVGHVLLDLGGITRISSFGVRQWMELTQRLPLGALGIYLLHAPPVLVDQLNMVEGFAGIGQVLSVLAPYSCPKCSEERVRVIDLKAAGPVIAAGGVPRFDCASCGSAMEFADVAPEYFDYVKQNPVRAVEPVVEKYLDSFKPPRSTDQSGYVKIVEGDLTYLYMASTLKANLSVRRLAGGLEGKVAYDFSGVAVVEPGALEKLVEVLTTAAQTATVILWRVPPVVLSALAAAPVPPRASLASLWLPCECSACGSSLCQSIEGGHYAQELQGAAQPSRSCGVCGGAVRVPALPAVTRLLSACPAVDVPVAELQAIEPRALSQLLQTNSASSPDASSPHTPTAPGVTLPGPSRSPADGSGERSGQALQLIRQVGRGGMAEVFLARQVGLKGFEKYVTVKRILPQFAQSPDFVEMLFAEARANARLTHPNVVQMFDVGMLDGVAHLTMEYVRGPDFKRVLVLARKSGSLVPVPHALRIVAETAAGLHYAHTFVDPMGNPHPVVHRDVSPHNILISLDGSVKLSDFGIAKVNDGGEGTRDGVFKGKIHYASPEQIRGLPLDARHDVFALGIVLYEALTGLLPFKGEDDAASLRALAVRPPPDPRQAVPGLPDEVCALALKALEKHPEDRFQSGDEFREAIEQVMSRYRYRSSPVDVANYVKGLLGDRLKDFSPTGTAEMTPSGVTSNPSMPGLNTPNPHTPSFGSQGRRSATGDLAPTAPPRLAPLAPATSGLDLQASPSSPPAPARAPASAARAAVAGEAPKPIAAPLAPAAPSPVAPEDVPRRRPWLWIAVGAGAVGALVAGGLVIGLGGERNVEVTNLGRGEQLFIGGVRVNPLALRPQSSDKPVVVAVAADGVLKRMGTSLLGAELDLQPLFDAAPGDGQTATLIVKSEPAGCPVQIDGKMEAAPTPMTTTIAAGKELELQVQCPGGPAWARGILGVPGQNIEVTARAKDDGR